MAKAHMTTLLFASEILRVALQRFPQSTDQLPPPHVCNKKHRDYNKMVCVEVSSGMSFDQLREKIFNHTNNLCSVHTGCRRNVKVFTLSEMEAKFPQLAKCRF